MNQKFCDDLNNKKLLIKNNIDMKKNNYLFMVFFLVTTLGLFSQDLVDNSNYEFEKYGVEQGTAMNASNNVYQDKLGYIWIGSQSGLDRFDGYEFTNFSNIISDPLSTNLEWVNAITEDSKGNIWATDQQGNVSKYDRYNQVWYNFDPIFKDAIQNIPAGRNLNFFPQPRTIIISPDDKYAYVGVLGFGLIRIDSETGDQKFYVDDFNFVRGFDPEAAPKMINEIGWIDDVNILVTTGNGIRIFNTVEEIYTDDIFAEEDNESMLWVSNFERINDSEFFLSTQKGVVKANILDQSIEALPDVFDISEGNSDLYYDKTNEEIWVNVDNVGIDIIHLKTEKVTKLREDNSSLLGNSFNNIIKDNQENIWISSNFAGVLKYDPNKRKFKSFLKDKPKNRELGIDVIWGLVFDNDGNIWAGSRAPGGGIVKVDLKNKTTKLYDKKNIDDATTYTIFKDKIGSIWAFKGQDLIVKRKNENRFRWLGAYNDIKKDQNQINRFFDPYMTYSGDVVFPGPIMGWIVDKNGNGKYQEYTVLTGKISEPTTGFHRIDSTTTYIISDRSIYFWDELSNEVVDLIPNKKEKLKKYLNSYQAPGVLHEGKLYFGTYGNGILYIDLETEDMGFITSNDGLPNMYLYNMFKDEDNNFWMASNQGIIKYNPNTKKFRQYTPIDGVQDYEFNAGTGAMDHNGYIAMGGLAGINYFDPKAISENSAPPQVIIQKITIGGVDVKLDAVSNSEVNEIEFKNNSLSFDYVAFNFRNTGQNQYKYKMDGYDENWIEAGSRRFASYTNLPIGSYTFRVLGSNNDGVWNEEGASYTLTILPPWYRTYFAYFIYVLLLVFGSRSFVKYREKKTKERLEGERKSKELNEAKNLQNSLLPKVNPSIPGYEISTYLKPATEVGGDYYDFFYKEDNYFYAICGDATGHGVVSGIMVSVTKAGLYGIPMGEPSSILGKLNRIVKRVNFGRLRMSLSVAKIEEDSIELSSAAMPPTYFYSSQTETIEEVLVPNLPLGGIETERFDGVKKEFAPGDFMVMISDGLPELPNPTNELLDYPKILDCLNKNREKNAIEIKDALVDLSYQWAKGEMNPDDITIVVIKKEFKK